MPITTAVDLYGHPVPEGGSRRDVLDRAIVRARLCPASARSLLCD